MSTIKLKRLIESHELDISPQLLDMKIGDMLDKMDSMDTLSDTEYEIVELILKTMSNDIIQPGYDREERMDHLGSIEDTDQEDEVIFTDDSTPNFNDVESGYMSNSKPDETMDNFEF